MRISDWSSDVFSSDLILCDDADLDRALPKVVGAGYRKAGQVCTSIQLLLVQDKILPEVEARLAREVQALKYGDPGDSGTTVGPLISEKEAVRIDGWIDAALARGARRLVGGRRQGAVVPPTLLADVDELGRAEGKERVSQYVEIWV